ncbi:uncharacterized protein LOC119073288 [Bradysia coprophila]|uniref:uncharacterized protein LOC119073288 n=1 Tax=Bradysia coprophila TaxID=38358 RepID=UPI00187DAD48|nr:uncharacterized protein LOC119073288 [Bradysia coprophila]
MNKNRDDSNISSKTSAGSSVGGVKHVATKSENALHENNTDRSVIGDANFLKGRRIADPVYMIREIQKLDAHSKPSGRCDFNNMKCYKEIRRGLASHFFFKCDVCGYEKAVPSNPPGKQNINTAAVAATNKIGIGFQEAETLFSHLEVPYLSASEYAKQQEKLKRKENGK